MLGTLPLRPTKTAMTTNMRDVGHRLRLARERKGLTQHETAQRSRVPISTYQGWEYGKNVMPCTEVQNLCSVLGVSAEWLLGMRPSAAPIEHPNYMIDQATVEALRFSQTEDELHRRRILRFPLLPWRVHHQIPERFEIATEADAMALEQECLRHWLKKFERLDAEWNRRSKGIAELL